MLNVLGESYYVDLDKIEEYLDMGQSTVTETTDSDLRINGLRYELIKLLLETVLTENDEGIDEKLGMKASLATTIPFKLAFNSLLNKKIITHY